jgi:hypothetical protein
MRPFRRLKIYLATSTNNALIDAVLAGVRADDHECYDFRASGRGPTKIFDPERKIWTPDDYVAALASPIAYRQYNADYAALTACDCTILLTPAGNDAHSEAGFARGQNIPVIVFLGEGFKPGLMHRFFNGFVSDIPGLRLSLSQVVPRDAAATGDASSVASPFPIPSSRYA